jgi:hypothetical protein
VLVAKTGVAEGRGTALGAAQDVMNNARTAKKTRVLNKLENMVVNSFCWILGQILPGVKGNVEPTPLPNMM